MRDGERRSHPASHDQIQRAEFDVTLLASNVFGCIAQTPKPVRLNVPRSRLGSLPLASDFIHAEPTLLLRCSPKTARFGSISGCSNLWMRKS